MRKRLINRRQFAAGTASALLATHSGFLRGQSDQATALPGQLASFTLRDYPHIFDFPEELLSYRVAMLGGVPASELRLYLVGKDSPLTFQLSEIEGDLKSVRAATLHFRADLKIGESKTFILLHKPGVAAAKAPSIVIESAGTEKSAIRANQVHVLVPSAGKKTLHLPVSQVPTPLLALAREPGDWAGQGFFDGPADLLVEEMEASILEQGPLFATYSVLYTFSGGRTYKAVLRVLYNERHVEIDEFSEGFGATDGLFFRFSYQKEIDPNGRLFMANGGYSTGGSQQGASGLYDQGVNKHGMLPIKLGVFTPNFINLPRSIVFWNDSGKHGLVVALRRLPDWKLSQRAVWSSSQLPDNFEFYSTPQDKYMRAAIVSPQRHWAIALIPRDEVVVRGLDMDRSASVPRPADKAWTAVSSMQGLLPYGAGPDVRLLQKLNDFSLDRYKTYIFDFPEDKRTAQFDLPHTDIRAEDMTAAEFTRSYKREYTFLAQVGWDYSGNMGANHWGWSMHPQSITYARNVTRWTPEERLPIRSWLVMAAYLMELDTAMPQGCMLGGHPNFAAEYKQALGIMAGLFPRHPHASRWRDTYLRFWSQYLDAYVRKGDPAIAAVAGRFTESIACYNYASLEAILMAATGFKQFDGTQILDRPEFRAWVNWELNSRLPFRVSGARIVPPQGAHAGMVAISPGGRWYNVAYAAAHLLRDTSPALADHWLWMITDGAEGVRPAVASTLFQAYGPVMRYNFGGPHEAFVHLQQLEGPSYRWGSGTNGAVYFAAKGKVWSWNEAEANGDEVNLSKLPVLQVGKSTLGPSTANSVLYDFGFAQFYRAQAGNSSSPYRSRALMLVRGDYIALADTLADGKTGDFHWGNETNGLVFHLYKGAESKVPFRTLINDVRFPLSFSDEDVRQLGIPAGPFVIRAEGRFTAPVAGHYKFRTTWLGRGMEVPVADSVHLVLDDKTILKRKGPQNGEADLEAREYAVHFEYVCAGTASPFVQVCWQRPDKTTFGMIESGAYRSVDPLPAIHTAQPIDGLQVNLVSPEPLEITESDPGRLRVGKKEYVLFSNSEKAGATDGPLFHGKSGYAGADGLALFEGDRLAWQGLGLTRIDGDFGVSIQRESSIALSGRIAGRSGGNLRIDLPDHWKTAKLKVTFDGKEVPFDRAEKSLSFQFSLTQADGPKLYRLVAV